MKTINNIVVFDNDPCFFALLKGYCYAKNIAIIEVDFNIDGIKQLEKIKPGLIVIPLNLVCTANKSFETGLLKRVCTKKIIKICGLNKNLNDHISFGSADWIDTIINDPLDIGEIDEFIKKTFLFSSCFIEKRRYTERRSIRDRRSFEYICNIDNEYKVTINSGYQFEDGNLEFKDFRVDQRNKSVFLKGHKVDLTPKEFELFDLLLTDVDRVFTADEIINHLWPESNRATKSDLYQYMHLLRKKIEKDPNNPQWIMNVKGFGYKLNVSSSEEKNLSGGLAKSNIQIR